MGYLIVLIVGLMAGVLSGIIGTGSSMMLMPVLVILYGPQQAVPVMAIASILGNLGKVLSWWREIDWRACIDPHPRTRAIEVHSSHCGLVWNERVYRA